MYKETKSVIRDMREQLLRASQNMAITAANRQFVTEALKSLNAVEQSIKDGDAESTFWETWDFVDSLRDLIFLKNIKTGEALRWPRPRKGKAMIQEVLRDAKRIRKSNPRLSRRGMADRLARPEFSSTTLRKKYIPKWERTGELLPKE